VPRILKSKVFNLIRSSFIFVYKKNIIGVNKWPDELPWTNNNDYNDMFISYFRFYNLWKKAYIIFV